jgi:hypothetical protein
MSQLDPGRPLLVPPRRELSDAERASIAVQTEMNALSQIVGGFEAMDPEARGRTLRYLADRYGQRPDKVMRPAALRPSEHPPS